MSKGVRENLLNQTFGSLFVESKIKGGWHCKCNCGNYKDVSTSSLKLGRIKSCGCFYKPRQILTKEFLEENYVRLKKSTLKISEETGFSQPTVCYNLKKNNIESRSLKEARKICDRKAATEATKRGYEKITGAFFCKIVDGARSRGIDFNLSIEYLWELFKNQNEKCSLSNLDIWFSEKENVANYKEYQTASLDRIDSTKGYIEGNVQWLHKEVNKIKQNLSQDRLIELCSLITKNQEKKI